MEYEKENEDEHHLLELSCHPPEKIKNKKLGTCSCFEKSCPKEENQKLTRQCRKVVSHTINKFNKYPLHTTCHNYPRTTSKLL